MDREAKNEAHRALNRVWKAIEEIDGPYSKMRRALSELDIARGIIIDDEVYASCEACGDPIWLDDPHVGDEFSDAMLHEACAPPDDEALAP